MSDTDFPASIATPAKTINDVINQLTVIVEWSKQNNSRMGYFAALYRKVTIQVKKGIEDGFFDDGQRMERLDVIFANRYIHACYQNQTDQTPTQSWVCAFDATERWWPIVLQHLLMGMNAHINLDLGIAAAETVPPEELPNLKGDFDKINAVLASLVGSIQNELAEIWPILGIMNRYLGSVEKTIINFSMEKARDGAWSFAEELSPLTGESRSKAIADKDEMFAAFSNVIMHPGFTLSAVLKIVRLGERGTVRERIGILE
ncbi:MAG: DUF5995 family protein [Nitrosomonas sp.]|nr:DUF5995 family protein [Nitrosomonas sp.]